MLIVGVLAQRKNLISVHELPSLCSSLAVDVRSWKQKMPLCKPFKKVRGGGMWWYTMKENRTFIMQEHKTGPPFWFGYVYRIYIKKSGHVVAVANTPEAILVDWEVSSTLTCLLHLLSRTLKLNAPTCALGGGRWDRTDSSCEVDKTWDWILRQELNKTPEVKEIVTNRKDDKEIIPLLLKFLKTLSRQKLEKQKDLIQKQACKPKKKNRYNKSRDCVLILMYVSTTTGFEKRGIIRVRGSWVTH